MAELKAYGAAATDGAACEAAATDQRGGVQQELPHQTSETVEAAAADKRGGVEEEGVAEMGSVWSCCNRWSSL